MGRDWQWGVIFDAGSSGTRAHIYKWTNESTVPHDHSTKDLASLPKLKLAKVEKTRPGISELADHPTDVGDYLQPLIDAAMAEIPAKKIPDTPIFVMATAGMRLVPEAPRAALLQQTCEYLRQNTRFHLPDCERHIRVIPGETEGLYGWLAANYLLGGFDQATDADDGARQDTYGFLDMGGASTQIVFAPNATEAAVHWDNLKLVRLRNVGGAASEYKVFSDSFLGFGANVARQRYVEALEDRYSTNGTDVLPDPCMPKGLRTTFTGDLVALDAIPPGEHTLVGTGDFEECLNQTYPLLRKDALCEDSPCLFNGQHAPAIDFDVTRFVGVSEYWHVTHGVFSSPGDKPYDLASYKENVDHFCGQDWAEIQRGILPRKKDSARKLQDAQDACFKASWMINVLYKGIGVPMTLSDTSRPDALNETAQDAQEGNLDAFMPINKIHGTEFSWTLGAMLLYVSGQILPTDASLPVGIGSNVAGIAADFERWGPSQWTTPVDGADTISEKAARAGPRLVVMALALVGLVLLLLLVCGREGRGRLYRKFGPTSRRRRRSSGSGVMKWATNLSRKLFGRDPSVTYDRILEEGSRGEFGSADFNSDDSDDSRAQEPAPSLGLRTFKDGSARADDRAVDASIDRSGLVVRTESRDRLTRSAQMLNAGRRSRAGSPTRAMSPLASMSREF